MGEFLLVSDLPTMGGLGSENSHRHFPPWPGLILEWGSCGSSSGPPSPPSTSRLESSGRVREGQPCQGPGHPASRRLALSSGQILTSGFIQINEMKSAGSPDLITVIHSLVVNNLCNKGLQPLQRGGGCGSAIPRRQLQELET
jgi:hypothetical protein